MAKMLCMGAQKHILRMFEHVVTEAPLMPEVDVMSMGHGWQNANVKCSGKILTKKVLTDFGAAEQLLCKLRRLGYWGSKR